MAAEPLHSYVLFAPHRSFERRCDLSPPSLPPSFLPPSFLPSFLPFRISLANILISILETKRDFVTVVASAPILNRERIDFKLDFENVN